MSIDAVQAQARSGGPELRNARAHTVHFESIQGANIIAGEKHGPQRISISI